MMRSRNNFRFLFLMFSFTWLICGSTFADEEKYIEFWGYNRGGKILHYIDAVNAEAECRYESLRLFAQSSESASDMSDKYDEFGQKLIESCMKRHGWRWERYEYKDGYYQRSESGW